MKMNGVDYYFMSLEEFQHKIQNQEFIEWEMVYEGRYYGTLKSEIQRLRNNNKIPILDIDVKGAIHVQEQYPEQSLSHFRAASVYRRIEKTTGIPQHRIT